MRKVCALFAVSTLLVFTAWTGEAFGQGANKIAVAASTISVFNPATPTVILNTTVKTSTNADLLLGLTAMCTIGVSDFQVLASSTAPSSVQNAEAVVMAWVEVDGTPVPVSGTDNGRVALCRLQRNESTFKAFSFAVEKTIVDSLIQATTTANGFNWIVRNVGNGTHSVKAKVVLQQMTFGGFSTPSFGFVNSPPMVQGAVGKRTLVIEPVLFSRVQ